MSPLDLLLSEEIGKTPDDITKWLCLKGVVGKRKSKRNNPIARLLNVYRAGVTWSGAEVHDGFVWFNDMQIVDYKLPEPVTEFLRRFDAGEYPELAEDGPLLNFSREAQHDLDRFTGP